MLTRTEMVIMAAIVHQPPHYILGYTWGEIASIVSIIVVVAGAIAYLVKVIITGPMMESNRALRQTIEQLSQRVEGIGGNADRIHAEHDHRLDKHEVRLARHDEEIENLKERIK